MQGENQYIGKVPRTLQSDGAHWAMKAYPYMVPVLTTRSK